MKEEYLTLETSGNIGIITLNNPPQNFIPTPDFVEGEILNSFLQQEQIKAILICGSGRHFSAGASLENLKTLAEMPDMLQKSLQYGKALLQSIENSCLPVISAIKGVCFGGGLEIALHSHIRVSAENALFAFPEINHGLMPGLSGTVKLPEITGVSEALQLFLSGNTIDAEKAKEIHLIDYIVPSKEVFEFSLQLLEKLVHDRPRYVIEAIIQSIMNSKKLPLAEALDKETHLFCHLAVNAKL
jgi:enoyl-CoA hydratase/carnithine racemase